VLIRFFETHKLRTFVLKKYDIKQAVELALDCCHSSVPYALSSAAALFWSIVVDVMIGAAAGNREQCTHVTLFLRFPSLVNVINVQSNQATTLVVRTNASKDPISTGLSTPLVLLSLCSQLAPPEGDPLHLHAQFCQGLVALCHSLRSSPQMLLRLLAAKSLARLTHPEELVAVVTEVLAALSQSESLSVNMIHGLLLQLLHLKLIYKKRFSTDVKNPVNEGLRRMKDKRILRCAATRMCVEDVIEA
jgi:hypothetical protein